LLFINVFIHSERIILVLFYVVVLLNAGDIELCFF